MKKSDNTIKTLVLSAALTFLGTIIGGYLTNYQALQLEKQKQQSTLILKAFDARTGEECLLKLKMLVRTNLITDSKIRIGVDSFVEEKAKNPGLIALGSMAEGPTIPNERLFLLSGKPTDNFLDDVSNTLVNSKYNVLASRSNLHDAGRPDNYQIRYFNYSDSSEAARLESLLSEKYNKAFPRHYVADASAKPGYIEIWLGR